VRRIDALIAEGRPAAEALESVGVNPTTYADWRSGIETSRLSCSLGRSQQPAQDPHDSVGSSDDVVDTPSTTVGEAAVARRDDMAGGVAFEGTLEAFPSSAGAEPGSPEAPSSTVPAAVQPGSDNPAEKVEYPAAVVPGSDDPSPDAEVVAGPAATVARGGDPVGDKALSAAPANPTRSDDRSDRLAAASDLELKLEYLAAEARRRRWRTFAFWSLLAGAPAMAFAAFIVTMGERAKAAMEEALVRDSAPLIAQLEQRGKAAEAMLQGLLQRGAEAEAAIGRQRQMAAIARPQIDQLQQEAASNRGELARLNAELAAISKAYSPRLARLDRQQADAVPRMEALGKTAESDRAEIRRLQSQVATISQNQAPLLAEMRKQGTDLGTRIDRLLQEAVRDRTELARLKAQVVGSSLSQQTGLVDEVTRLRQEVSANRTGLSRLEGAVDAIKQASSGTERLTELDTSAIALAGPGSETPQGPPASRSPRVPLPPNDVVLPKAASPRVALENSARTRAVLQTNLQAQDLEVLRWCPRQPCRW
jgi:hypothetical protein